MRHLAAAIAITIIPMALTLPAIAQTLTLTAGDGADHHGAGLGSQLLIADDDQFAGARPRHRPLEASD